MNFDRSAVSLRLHMGYVDKINRMYIEPQQIKHVKSAAGPFLAARGIIGSNLDDATNIISRL